MAWTVRFKPSAARAFEKLPRPIQERIAATVRELSENPWPTGVQKLAGAEGLWRVRVGDFRLVYEVVEESRTVMVARIGHRREVYRR